MFDLVALMCCCLGGKYATLFGVLLWIDDQFSCSVGNFHDWLFPYACLMCVINAVVPEISLTYSVCMNV